jgi:hypothetical protein
VTSVSWPRSLLWICLEGWDCWRASLGDILTGYGYRSGASRSSSSFGVSLIGTVTSFLLTGFVFSANAKEVSERGGTRGVTFVPMSLVF